MFRHFLTICIIYATATAEFHSRNEFELAKKGLTEILRQGYASENNDVALRKFELLHLLRDHPGDIKVADADICGLCRTSVDIVIEQVKNGTSKDDLIERLTDLCVAVKLEESYRVCHGMVSLNIDVITYIIENKPDLTSERVCAAKYQSINCDKGENFDWEIPIPQGYTKEKPKKSTDETFNILQISDIHYDPLYTPGKTSKCGEPMCCQSDQSDGSSESDTCGYWSHYDDSDIPWYTVMEALRHASTQSFDYVYYTGDIISHRVWNTDKENNTEVITKLYKQFEETFDVPVYPILGNHEPSPFNLYTETFNVQNVSTNWIFELVADLWSVWLPEDAIQTVLKGGYYTVSPKPGFRIVALNNNVCYISNWWLDYEDFDPFGQLTWLTEVLLEAEKNGESVHILAHVPSGTSSCLAVWGREYTRVVERFANTITGQFNGHTHVDEFTIYYNQTDASQALGVAFNGASVTTFTQNNPSYKVYAVNQETYTLEDVDEWTFNLTLANLNEDATPEWYKLYSFKDAYGVQSLDAVEVNDLVYKMAKNHTLLETYHMYSRRNADPVVQEGCSESCQKSDLCTMTTSYYGFKEVCTELKKIWDENA